MEEPKYSNAIALVINGVARAGKDTFIDALRETEKYRVISGSIVDSVKQVAYECGWEGGKSEKDRQFLADLKVLMEWYNDFPFRETMAAIDDRLETAKILEETRLKLICVMARNPHTLQRYVDWFKDRNIPVKTVCVRNTEAEKNVPENLDDMSVFDFQYDVHIWNDTSEYEFRQSIASAYQLP